MKRAAGWILWAGLFAGCGSADGAAKPVRRPPPPVGAAAGQSAPVLDLLDSRGGRWRTTSWIGRRAQLLVMGTTQCPRCESRVADVEAVRTRLGESVEVAVILFSETAERAEAFAARHGTRSRLILDPQNTGISLYKPGPYPHFVLIDKSGVIRYTGLDLPDDAKILEAASAAN